MAVEWKDMEPERIMNDVAEEAKKIGLSDEVVSKLLESLPINKDEDNAR